MSGAMGLAALLLGGALLAFLHGEGEIGGLPADQFASLLALVALALLVANWVVQEFRGHWTRGVQAVVFWAALTVGGVALYSYRYQLHEVASRVVSDMGPAEPAIGTGGEVSVARRLDGTFVIAGRANDRDLRFIFDTGASMVVLTTETAQTLGLGPGDLNYGVPVFTANGRTLAAPVTLDTLRIGSITERRVRALVARPGVLRENLLGMTFLERLTSYEVRGNRLILRGRTT